VQGKIVSIHIAAQPGGELLPLPAAELVAGRGIVGDRYFDDVPDNLAAVTLVEAEVVEEISAVLGMRIEAHVTRRNIVTRGITLNDYVGRELTIGGAVIEGIELCEPCGTLGEALAGALSTRELVRAFVHRGGLRGRIVASGTVKVDDPIG